MKIDHKNSDFVESLYIGKGLDLCFKNILHQETKIKYKTKITKFELSSSLDEQMQNVEWKIPDFSQGKFS